MSISLSDVREQVNDRYRTYPPPQEAPEFIGTGDGVTVVFYLPHQNVLAGSLQIYESNPSPSVAWTGVASSKFTLSGNVVTFGLAPASGLLIGARYQATAFSDTQLTGILTRNQAIYGTDDQRVLKGCSYDIIDVLLTDLDRLKLVRYGEFMSNPGWLVKVMHDMKNELKVDLEGNPVPYKAQPAMTQAAITYQHYVPRR